MQGLLQEMQKWTVQPLILLLHWWSTGISRQTTGLETCLLSSVYGDVVMEDMWCMERFQRSRFETSLAVKHSTSAAESIQGVIINYFESKQETIHGIIQKSSPLNYLLEKANSKSSSNLQVTFHSFIHHCRRIVRMFFLNPLNFLKRKKKSFTSEN